MQLLTIRLFGDNFADRCQVLDMLLILRREWRFDFISEEGKCADLLISDRPDLLSRSDLYKHRLPIIKRGFEKTSPNIASIHLSNLGHSLKGHLASIYLKPREA